MGISLWLVPESTQMNVIESCLPERPSMHSSVSPSSFPAILPHITLATVTLSDTKTLLPGAVLLDAVPENQQSIRVNFQSLVIGDHYFRSVFIDVQPTEELVGFQKQILTDLRRRGLEPSAPRFPHMSLCYITDEDRSQRDRTAQVLKDTGVVVSRTGVDTQTISLQCGDVCLQGFDGVEVWMVNCEGPVGAWKVDGRKVKLTQANCRS